MRKIIITTTIFLSVIFAGLMIPTTSAKALELDDIVDTSLNPQLAVKYDEDNYYTFKFYSMTKDFVSIESQLGGAGYYIALKDSDGNYTYPDGRGTFSGYIYKYNGTTWTRLTSGAAREDAYVNRTETPPYDMKGYGNANVTFVNNYVPRMTVSSVFSKSSNIIGGIVNGGLAFLSTMWENAIGKVIILLGLAGTTIAFGRTIVLKRNNISSTGRIRRRHRK